MAKILSCFFVLLMSNFVFANAQNNFTIALKRVVEPVLNDTLLVGNFKMDGIDFKISVWNNRFSPIFKVVEDSNFTINICDTLRNEVMSFYEQKNLNFSLFNNSFRIKNLDVKNQIFSFEKLPQKIITEHELNNDFPNLNTCLKINGSADDIKKMIHEKKYNHYFLNLWTTFCIPCIKHFKQLSKFDSYNTFVINVCGGGADSAAINLIHRLHQPQGFNFYCELDVYRTLNLERGFPACALFDENGKLEYFYTAQNMDDVFKKLEADKKNGK